MFGLSYSDGEYDFRYGLCYGVQWRHRGYREYHQCLFGRHRFDHGMLNLMELWVKVKKGWTNDSAQLRRLGLDDPS